MNKLVVDASVAMKWFVPEVHSDAAARLLDADFVLCAPDLIVSEVGNTLWKKVRRGELTARDAEAVIAAFNSIPMELYSSRLLMPAAFEIAVTLDRTVYDSLYLALAVIQKCALVTADRKFHSVLVKSAFTDHIAWVEGFL